MSIGIDLLEKLVDMGPRRRSIEIREGVEFEYFSTPVTLAERGRAQKAAKDDTVEMALQLLVVKAQTKDGQLMFNAGDIATLKHKFPASVSEGLMLQLLQDPEPEEGEAELDMKSSRRGAAKVENTLLSQSDSWI